MAEVDAADGARVEQDQSFAVTSTQIERGKDKKTVVGLTSVSLYISLSAHEILGEEEL